MDITPVISEVLNSENLSDSQLGDFLQLAYEYKTQLLLDELQSELN